ncbi:MAG: hypothetical protein SPI65_03400 [Peptoniphilus sp.]|nr:hypothetical protein [Peptoniphilus sp.]MDD7363766.1 hypothetical protein [Bacillota bacterium]MDY6044607.1 hypothetical protein [Peptoniphilus sp.]
MQTNKRGGERALNKENRFPGTRDVASKAEDAVRRAHKKSASLTVPLLRRKGRIKAANILLRAVLPRRKRRRGMARTVQKARLSSRRRFFTGDDVKRAVYDTSRALNKARREVRHGK